MKLKHSKTMKRFNLISALEITARVLMIGGLLAVTLGVLGFIVSLF